MRRRNVDDDRDPDDEDDEDDDRETTFSRLAGDQEARLARQRARDAVAYEESRLAYLLQQFRLMPREGRRLRQVHDERFGGHALRFAVFHDEHPTFPVVLGTEPLSGLHVDPRCFLPNLFKSFPEAPFVAAYEAHFDLMAPLADGRAVGLVFRRKGIRQGLVIHNGEDLPRRVFQGLVLTYQARGKAAHRLFVQPYQTLVEQLHAKGHGWRP